jgi:hypothetical protein
VFTDLYRCSGRSFLDRNHKPAYLWRNSMTTAINALLTEMTEEEASTVQGGLGFFSNESFLMNGMAGFRALFYNIGSSDATGVSGTAESIPGTTAPISSLAGLDPTKPDVRLNQFLIIGLAALFG